jgi:hypothetical protein
MDVGTRKQKFFSFVLFCQFYKVRKAFLTVKNLSFPVLNVFLKIISGGFGDAEVLHAVGYLDPHLFADPEEMIYGIPGSEDNCSIVQDVHAVLPKFLGRNTFNLYEFAEYNTDIKFFRQISIR